MRYTEQNTEQVFQLFSCDLTKVKQKKLLFNRRVYKKLVVKIGKRPARNKFLLRKPFFNSFHSAGHTTKND